ncbi:MAG TPA: ABC transporter substrate-binding protein [Candidatus Lustribacter sp.]|jgi:ABC-type nitrate/sulfonate/bicarbonate transport system substrate-binding protein|nr:ABC transporter substrate-binding protein [Candidatus Lustribacter sp.]
MKRLRVLALLVLASLVLGPSTAARAQTPLIPLEVGLGDVSLTKLIFLVAADAGVYAKDGLAVQQFISPRAAEVVRRSGVIVPPQFIRAATGDDVPITIEGGAPRIVQMTTSALASDRVIIATTDNTARFHIISRSDITSPEQLKGKRLGYTEYGAITHLMAIVFAQKMGWNPDRDISLMADGTAYDVLAKGREDAFVGDEILQAMASKLGYRDLLDLSTYHIPLAGSGINAERTWLRDHRDIAARFVKATVDALALVKTNKAVAFASLAKWYNITDPEQQERIYRNIADLPRKPYPAVDGVKEVMAVYRYRELQIHPPEYFYDDSFVRALDQSGYIDSLYK